MRKITVLLLLMGLLFLNCKQENSSDSPNATNTISEAQTASYQGDLIIRDKNGVDLFALNLDPVAIKVNGKNFTYKEKPDKRKYFNNGSLEYEIKLKPDGFKLRDASSNLLWKVKVYPDKIKISDNEENENPFEIRNKGEEITISKNGSTGYSVKLTDTQIEVNGESLYSTQPAKDNYALGILAIEEIPIEHRAFILAEYLYQNK